MVEKYSEECIYRNITDCHKLLNPNEAKLQTVILKSIVHIIIASGDLKWSSIQLMIMTNQWCFVIWTTFIFKANLFLLLVLFWHGTTPRRLEYSNFEKQFCHSVPFIYLETLLHTLWKIFLNKGQFSNLHWSTNRLLRQLAFKCLVF